MSELVEAVLVDDDKSEADTLTDLLKADENGLRISLLQPLKTVEDTAAAIRKALPEGTARIVLLDYRLEDHVTDDGRQVLYRGGSVAGDLRDHDPDLPIVLLTSEKKLHDYVERRPGMQDVFDWTLIKNEITAQDGSAIARERIVSFARGWQESLGWPDNVDEMWSRMAVLMAAPEGGIDPFRELEAKPPRGDAPGSVMDWLLHRALDLPGPLLNEPDARVTLGLDQMSFGKPEVAGWLEDAAYRGALKAFGTRWWAHLLRAKLAEACDGRRPVSATDRTTCLTKALGVKLKAEGCTWCGGERTLQACQICAAATDAAHAVRPLTQPLPPWADAPVVCYRCIAEGRAENRRFPPSSQEVVDGLKEDEIRPPG